MKKLAILLLALFFAMEANAQQNGASEVNYSSDLQKIATIKSKGRILVIKPEYQIPAAQFFGSYAKELGLASAEDMVLRDETASRGTNKTYRYGQMYHGIPIEGATMILHEKNGVVTYANGMIIQNFYRPFTPVVQGEDAILTALLNTRATKYAWENESMEQDLKMIRNDEKATYYPTPRLIFFDPQFSSDARNYRLTYEVNVFAIEPLESHTYYIDATTGEVLKSVKKNQNVNVEVQAKTRYNGVQTITVDSVIPTQFVLRENSRGAGNGIYTRSLNNSGSMIDINTSQATDVVEADNFFDTDSVANAAHFGAENTYDFYYEKFGRNSIDNQGLQLLSYVHLGQSVENAMWTNGAMFYGDGVGGYQFTFLSVCGHEITHGLTEHTANLYYEYESGALNEAFSDMFGASIAYYASDTLKWTIGDELGTAFRDMSNPKVYQNPDTYHGQYWVTGSDDNGGVHSNSGPANYWFYLLCAGGEGTNDHGNAYRVNPIGIDKADSLIFYTLTENLTETSDYQETYELSLIVAADLFGECSDEVLSVADAWHAIGVGYNYSDTTLFITDILSPATDCALGSEEPVTLELLYNSCSQPLPAGTEIEVRIVLDNTTEITETYVTTEVMVSGTPFAITLNQTLDVSATGAHSLKAFVHPEMTEAATDSITDYSFTNLVYQNTDVHVVDIVSPVSACFLSNETAITARFTFDVCDSIAAGDSVRVGYRLDVNGAQGDTIVEYIVFEQTVTQEDTLEYTFHTLADFSQSYKFTLRVYSLNPGDLDASDNTRSAVIYSPTPLNKDEWINFEENEMKQYYFTEKEEYANITIGTLSGYNGGKVVNMTGGNAMEYYNDIEFPNPLDWWGANLRMNSRITFCADATDYAELGINFDLKQTSGNDIYQQMLGDYIPGGMSLLQSSMMRVLVDGQQVSQNFTPATSSNDPFQRRGVNLCDYIGGKHTITFEAKCFAGDLFIYTLDHVYLDNITLVESTGISHYLEIAPNIFTYPNPATDNVTIVFENLETASAPEYQLFDLFGRNLLNGKIMEESTSLNISSLANGIYLLKVMDGNQTIGTAKIVKN
ncbi:MAG: M4 family metallopeptidase [Bacteroidales bacterium]|nr:M4 family metallopeptidase [Bacteroidales bacterium]